VAKLQETKAIPNGKLLQINQMPWQYGMARARGKRSKDRTGKQTRERQSVSQPVTKTQASDKSQSQRQATLFPNRNQTNPAQPFNLHTH